MQLNEQFWSERYTSNSTGWDLGEISTPLKSYFDQLVDKAQRILLPGAGNSYEAEYLNKAGFQDVTVVDLANEPLQNLKKRCPNFPDQNLVQGDFFGLDGSFDLIIEQTFFCAIDPTLRSAYAKKMHELLAPGGKLVGVMFNIPLNADHPPFGGDAEEYIGYFDKKFELKVFEACYNSIPPRAGSELFINLKKR